MTGVPRALHARFSAAAYALVLNALLGCAAEPPRECPEAFAIVSARIFDGTGVVNATEDDALPVDGTVLVCGDRIAAVGARREVEIPRDARIFDAAGGTALPGLIDSHVHLTNLAEQRPEAANAWLRAGVTTVVGMGTSLEPAELRRLLGEAPAPAPRVLSAGGILTAPGGYPFAGPESSAREVEDQADLERALTELLAESGADHLKVAIERGFTQDWSDDGWPALSPKFLGVITRRAHARGLRVSAHLTQAEEFAVAVAAGIDNIAHAPIEELSDAALTEAAGRDVVLVTSASIWRETPTELATVLRNLRRFLELGGRIALGTDAPAFQTPGLPLTEIRLLAEGGLTPTQILTAATRSAAFAFGLENELGAIAPGFLADLVVVRGDPTRELESLLRVELILKAGVPVPLSGTGSDPAIAPAGPASSTDA